MEGGDDEEQQGIIPRTISKILEETKCLVEKVKKDQSLNSRIATRRQMTLVHLTVGQMIL